MFFLNDKTETIQHLININRQNILYTKIPIKIKKTTITKKYKTNKFRHIRKYYNTKYAYMQYSLTMQYKFVS